MVRGPDLDSGKLLQQFCGRQENAKVLSPGFGLTHVIFKSDISVTNRGFNLTFTYNDCGGTFNGPFTNIASSQTNQDCVWLLEYEQGQQIILSRFR